VSQDGEPPQPAPPPPVAHQPPPAAPAQARAKDAREALEAEREKFRQERAHMQRLRITEAGVALAALFVSCTVFLLNGALFMRGSSVSVLEPRTVLFYRDAGPNGASLWIAVQASMINAASPDYGDVIERAWISIGPQVTPARFQYDALIEPVPMTRDVEGAVKNCPNGARCIPATGFYVVSRPDQLLDVPGGASLSPYMSFLVENIECEGPEDVCARFQNYETVVRLIRSLPDPFVRITIKMHFDGRKTVHCALPKDPAFRKAIFDYLDEKGWAEVQCQTDN
jgi:hypothetical protein